MTIITDQNDRTSSDGKVEYYGDISQQYKNISSVTQSYLHLNRQNMDYLLLLLFGVVTLFLYFLYNKFRYWHHRGVPTSETHMFLGSWLSLKTMHHTSIMQNLYDRFKGLTPIAGFYIYTQPVAVILDINLIQSILVKDFNYFVDRMSYNNNKDIISKHLFNLEGTKWRPLRHKLTATFSSAQMKYMYPTVTEVALELNKTYESCLESDDILNVTDINSRFTTDVIGSCAFGIDCNSLKNPNAEIRKTLSYIFGGSDFNVRWKLFKQTYAEVTKFLGFKRYPQFIEDFFASVLKTNIMERESLGIKRKDFMELLLELKNTKDENGNPSLSYNEIIAQLFVFFFAGFETSSSTMSSALYLLAKHPDEQDKVRQEIVDVLKEYNNEMTYEAINKMSYLDQIISENLRLYPILGFLQRTAVADYEIPNTNIVLEKGTMVLIPVKCIHHDAEIYERPEEFLPERFHTNEVVKRHPQSFLGFGDGPRNCIGLRFGRIQVRVGLVTLLTKYKFSVCEKTVENFRYSDHTFAQKAVEDIWLKVEKV